MNDQPFLTDVLEIRRRARQHIEEGAVTDSYRGDRQTVIKILNDALATELVCVLRYKRHYFMAQGIHAEPIAQEFLQHANEEQGHAEEIGLRKGDGIVSRSVGVAFSCGGTRYLHFGGSLQALKCGFSMMPKMLPKGSVTVATLMPPPTSWISECFFAPSRRRRFRARPACVTPQ